MLYVLIVDKCMYTWMTPAVHLWDLKSMLFWALLFWLRIGHRLNLVIILLSNSAPLSWNRYFGRNVCKTGPGETESAMTQHDWWLSLYNVVNLHVFTNLRAFRDLNSLLRWNGLLQADCTQMISLHKLIRVHKNMASQGNLFWCHFIKNTSVWIYDLHYWPFRNFIFQNKQTNMAVLLIYL